MRDEKDHETIQLALDEISQYFSDSVSKPDPKKILHGAADVSEIHWVPPTSDSSKLRLNKFPIKYDKVYQKLIKKPDTKEDWDIEYLGAKTKRNICTRLPRTS